MKKLIKSLIQLSLYQLYSFIKEQRLKRKSRKIIKKYFDETSVKKLHIGAGGQFFDTWLNVDIQPLNNNVAYMDASEKFPFESESFELIYSEHLFEHLTLQKQQVMLFECNRILVKGGKIRIATPNFDFIVSQKKGKSETLDEYINWYIENFFKNELEKLGDNIKSEVYFVNNYFHNWGHEFIHNFDSIENLLRYTNFFDIKKVQIYESDSPEFKDIEKHGTVIPKVYNDLETLVIEAKK